MAVLNDRLAVQKVAVTEATEACEKMLEEISSGTAMATEKKKMAEEKATEIAEQSKVIAVEKVCFSEKNFFLTVQNMVKSV